MPWPGVIVFALPPGPVEVEPILFPSAGQYEFGQWVENISKRSDAPILDLLGHGQERLLDIGRTLRGGLKEGDIQLIGEFLECQNGSYH